MKISKLLGFASLTISLGLLGCGEIETPVEPTPDPTPEEVKSEITIDAVIITNGLSFTSAKGEKSISFTTNEDWNLNIATTPSGDTWCTASTTSGGKGNANVKFSVTENTSYDDRSVSVTIKSGTASKTFTITQKHADALLLTTNKYELSPEGGAIEIEVKANIDYEMEIAENAKDWITETKTRALTTYKHTLTIATNEEVEKREGEIYFKSGDKVETVKIYQEGAEAIIVLSQKEYTVSDTGETISVDIRSNIEYSVQMPDVDWITDEPNTRGMSSHTLRYTISPNEGYDSRTAEIIFYDNNSDLKEIVKIVQMQKDAIIIAQNEYTIEAKGGNLEFDINTNVDFEVTCSVNWLRQNIATRGLVSKPLSFTIDENTSGEDREGLIVISYGELTQEIKVFQKKNIVFHIPQTEFYFTRNEVIFELEIQSTGEYTIKMPDVDWMSLASGNWCHVYENETDETREAEIVVTHKETNQVVKVKVVQGGLNGIIIAHKTYDVKSEGETIEVNLSTNKEYEIIMPDVDWISQVSSQSSEENTLYFKIDENNAYSNRSTTIIFEQTDSDLRESITINQSGHNQLILSEAGTLKEIIGDDFLNVQLLTIIGPINGDDIYCLRKMLGAKNFNEANRGKLTTLDLSQATIVEGGEWYYEDYLSTHYYTSNDEIGDYMFYDCVNLQKIILPTNIAKVGKHAFENCESLAYFELPHNVTAIDTRTFSGCKALSSFVISDNVTTIGMEAFKGCASLSSVTIGKGITTIASEAFYGCNAIESVYITDLSAWCKIVFADEYDNPLSKAGTLYLNGKLLTDLVIPKDITEIKDYTFYGCKSITNVTIGENITSIGNYVFCGCSSLSSLTINANITSWGYGAFKDCVTLNSVTLSEDATMIGGYAFQNCTSLTAIPSGKNITTIETHAFDNCDGLVSINIPDNVTTLGSSSFNSCGNLASVVIGDGVTVIEASTFMSCYSLTSVTVGKRINKISPYAFHYCNKHLKFYCNASTPPKLESNPGVGETIYPFDETSKYYEYHRVLYVPERCSSAYQSAGWGMHFEEIIEMN